MTNTATLNTSNKNINNCDKLKDILRTKQKTIPVKNFTTCKLSKVRQMQNLIFKRERDTHTHRQTTRQTETETNEGEGGRMETDGVLLVVCFCFLQYCSL